MLILQGRVKCAENMLVPVVLNLISLNSPLKIPLLVTTAEHFVPVRRRVASLPGLLPLRLGHAGPLSLLRGQRSPS